MDLSLRTTDFNFANDIVTCISGSKVGLQCQKGISTSCIIEQSTSCLIPHNLDKRNCFNLQLMIGCEF
ncbi:MAG: hypothetical protein ACJA1A_000614 [Saprospiraceae bacterium]|jgi:hypothetical protein